MWNPIWTGASVRARRTSLVHRVLLAVATLTLLAAAPAVAAVPASIPLQGMLRDAAGLPVEDGAWPATFSLFNSEAGLDALWMETWPPVGEGCDEEPDLCVRTEGGIFALLLGTQTPLSAELFDGEASLWLEITLHHPDGDVTLPRAPLGATAYALVAARAETARRSDQADEALHAATSDDLSCAGCVSPDELGPEPIHAASLPSGGLDEVSGGVLSSTFTSHAAADLGAGIAVEDFPGAWALATIEVQEDGILEWLSVRAQIEHPDASELVVTLVAPDGQLVVLHQDGVGDEGGLDQTWPPALPAVGSLDSFTGMNASGTWTLQVQDMAAGDTGSVLAFEIDYATWRAGELMVAAATSVEGDLSVQGAVSFGAQASVGGGLTVQGDLSLGGALQGPVQVTGGLDVGGPITATGALTLPADGLTVGTDQLATRDGNVGIGTTQPSARLTVKGYKRYLINQPIIASTQAPFGEVSAFFILLHRAYEDTKLNDHYVFGTISARRGDGGAFNRKVIVEVDSASAYNTNRGFVRSRFEDWKLHLVRYEGQRYMALEAYTSSSLSHIEFTGWAAAPTEHLLKAVATSEVSEVTPYTAYEAEAVTGSQTIRGRLGVGNGPQATLDVNGSLRLRRVPMERQEQADGHPSPRCPCDQDAGGWMNAAFECGARFFAEETGEDCYDWGARADGFITVDASHRYAPSSTVTVMTTEDPVDTGVSFPDGLRAQRLVVDPGADRAELRLAGSEIFDAYDMTLHIRSGGNLVLFDGGDAVQIDERLDVNGNIHATGCVQADTVECTSARAAKTDISPLDGATYREILAQLEAIEFVLYRYKREAATRPPHLGLIAEDAPAHIVTPDRQGLSLSDYISFVAAAVQELARQRDEAATERAALLRRLERLEERLRAVEGAR